MNRRQTNNTTMDEISHSQFNWLSHQINYNRTGQYQIDKNITKQNLAKPVMIELDSYQISTNNDKTSYEMSANHSSLINLDKIIDKFVNCQSFD